MVRIAPLLLVALVGCQRAAPFGHPALFSDPAEVDLAVDSPLDVGRTADVVVANIGDRATVLSQVGLVGTHAALVAVDAPIGAGLEPGGIAVIHLSLVGPFDPAEGAFAEELELWAIGEPTEHDDPVAVTIVRVGTLAACDRDLDGHLSESCGGDDCDDDDAERGPDMAESCNGVDDDCDGLVDGPDSIDALAWFPDQDEDGAAAFEGSVSACERPDGFLDHAEDCDDADAAIHPSALEVCDGVDQDCDGATDEDATDALRFYGDGDGDGHGGSRETTLACTAPEGFTEAPDDCNDKDASVYPGAPETCDDMDDDCDGVVDDDAVDAFTVFWDQDRDKHGNPLLPYRVCALKLNLAAAGDDCDDVRPTVFPGAPELCNGVDDDCDGLVDDGASSGWYRDTDGDKFGDPAAPSVGCAPQPGDVRDGSDCNDADKAVFPGAVETCDGRDQDCDGAVDDSAVDGKTFYADADGDTFGNRSLFRVACTKPASYVRDSTDCNDADAGVFPGAIEVCDGVDQDCDGVADDGATGGGTWYRDRDKDAFGNDLDVSTSCSQPAGYVAVGGDCDDRSPVINPNGKETCNGRDDDCDGLGDEGGVCPCPTFNWGTSTYMVCDLQVPAVAALAACKNFGYTAADVDSAEEDAFLDTAVNVVNPSRSFFIGLNDLNVEGRHEWYSGLPVTYLDWSPGQPNDPNGQEDCVVIDASRHWSDVSCFNNNPFVCEHQ